jgi:hypothetical protein
MPRPLQHVHREQRRVGHLQEENLVPGDIGDAGGIVLQRERVKAVENEPEVRVVGASHDVPCLAVQVRLAAPRKRLEADPQIPRRGARGEFVQLRGGEFRVVDRQRRRVRTAQHHRYVQLLHQVELALGAVEAALELHLGHAFEIAEWLIQVDGQA